MELCPACLLHLGLRGHQGRDPTGRVDNSPPDSAGGVDEPTPDELANSFSQFEIVEVLGSGEMGTVYKARDRRIDRLIALKIMSRSLRRDQRIEAMHEARAMASLNHTNIVRLHEVSEQGGRPYFVMEWVNGASLLELTRRKRFAAGECVAIAQQLCEALRFARGAGIVARNLKPRNILLDER